jgi:hypothetical protein
VFLLEKLKNEFPAQIVILTSRVKTFFAFHFNTSKPITMSKSSLIKCKKCKGYDRFFNEAGLIKHELYSHGIKKNGTNHEYFDGNNWNCPKCKQTFENFHRTCHHVTKCIFKGRRFNLNKYYDASVSSSYMEKETTKEMEQVVFTNERINVQPAEPELSQIDIQEVTDYALTEGEVQEEEEEEMDTIRELMMCFSNLQDVVFNLRSTIVRHEETIEIMKEREALALKIYEDRVSRLESVLFPKKKKQKL